MKKIGLILLIVSFVPILGCLGENVPICSDRDGYFYCEYSGVFWSYQYCNIYIEENELVDELNDEYGVFRMVYSHPSTRIGLGHYRFQIVNSTTNLTETYQELSISINDVESAPGGIGDGGYNVFVTNLSLRFDYWTRTDANFTGSDSYEETDRLSEVIFSNDMDLNRDLVLRLEENILKILGKKSDSLHVGRNYNIVVS